LRRLVPHVQPGVATAKVRCRAHPAARADTLKLGFGGRSLWLGLPLGWYGLFATGEELYHERAAKGTCAIVWAAYGADAANRTSGTPRFAALPPTSLTSLFPEVFMSMHTPPISAVSAASGEGASCRRCGTCCLRGGPTLMVCDAARLVSGDMTLEALVCLRAGEWARDDAQGLLRPLEGERIKVAGLGGRAHPWRCRFYREATGCTIYAQRPAQCAALFCMDTGPLQALLEREAYLGRVAALQALGAEIPGFSGLGASTVALLPDIVRAHEEQNPVRPVLALAAQLGFVPSGGHGIEVARDADGEPRLQGEAQAQAFARLGEAARTDAAFRDLCVERAGVPAAMLPFLLGRSLRELLAEVGLRPSQNNG